MGVWLDTDGFHGATIPTNVRYIKLYIWEERMRQGARQFPAWN
jgi:hypothetical protein